MLLTRGLAGTVFSLFHRTRLYNSSTLVRVFHTRPLLCAVFSLVLACHAANRGEKIKIGYCDNNFNDTFHIYMLDAATEYANANNIELMVMDAQLDSVRQQDYVQTMISDGVKAVIVIPCDTTAVAKQVRL